MALQRYRSERTSEQKHAPGISDRHILGLLRHPAHESMAGNPGIPSGIAFRICILQDRFIETHHADALHQQHPRSHHQQDPAVQGGRDLHGCAQPVGILVHLCRMHRDSLLFDDGLQEKLRNFSARSRVSSLPTSTRFRSEAATPYIS